MAGQRDKQKRPINTENSTGENSIIHPWQYSKKHRDPQGNSGFPTMLMEWHGRAFSARSVNPLQDDLCF
jgi:hypothetical protein